MNGDQKKPDDWSFDKAFEEGEEVSIRSRVWLNARRSTLSHPSKSSPSSPSCGKRIPTAYAKIRSD